MLHNFAILPTELQASVLEMRADGMSEEKIDRLVDRMLSALETKSNKVQIDVWNIEKSLGKKLEQIGGKLQNDLQTQHGETNGMLVDIRASVREQEAVTVQLRAEFHAFGETVSGRIAQLEHRQDALEQRVDSQWNESKGDRADLRKQGKATQAAVKDISTRLDTFIARIDNLIAQSVPPEKAQEYRAFLDDLMRERAGS